ncbi:MAG: hypothetical protein R2822_26350 [Spirosomataceae bacterium]
MGRYSFFGLGGGVESGGESAVADLLSLVTLKKKKNRASDVALM